MNKMLFVPLLLLAACAREGAEMLDEHPPSDGAHTEHHDDHAHAATDDSHEGRTTIAADAAEEAGIETAVAGPGTIAQTATLYGSIRPDITRVREVKARFPGVIQRVNGQIGDTVRAGESLAAVESNESLRTYSVASPIDGVITQRHADPGEQTGDDALFEVADFSQVWAEFSVFPRDRARVRTGQRVRISAEGTEPAEGTISYISPLGSRDSQSIAARVVLDNAQRTWTPGQFVEGQVVLEETPVDLAVPLSALQTLRGSTVVFAQMGERYEARALELGRRDAERVEVLGGLEPGTRYVTENSFLIKADIEKSGAGHDH